MKRKTNVRGYTKSVNGKTVHVKPHSRNTGKEGAAAQGAGGEFKARKSSSLGDALLSRMFSLGAKGEVKELPFDPSEITYAGPDSAEVGINPQVKPGEKLSASRKQWLADLDRKLTPEEKAKYGRKDEEKPLSKEEFAASLARAKTMQKPKGPRPVAPVAPPKPKKRTALSSIIDEFQGYYKQFKKK